ncbi:MAG: hypothetical protein DWQ10_14555 [Calditrichaeota bacterium]|nr:MAG: hypothetical protein DWQ10_14555 [Calditrichota bacterium]
MFCIWQRWDGFIMIQYLKIFGLLLITGLLLQFKSLKAQNLQEVWLDRQWSYELVKYAGLAIDQDQNVYIAGNDPPFLQIRDEFGNGRNFQDVPWEISRYFDLKVDGAGNVILIGDNHIQWPDPQTHLYLAKYNSDGQELWKLGDIVSVRSAKAGIAIDSQDNIVLAGLFGSTDSDSSGISLTLDNQTITSVKGLDIFIAKFTPNGEIIWLEQMGTEYHENFTALAVDNEDNILILGQSELSGSPQSTFWLKLAPGGTQVWTKDRLQSYAPELGSVQVNSANEYILPYLFTGEINYEGTQYASPDNDDILFRKFDQNGHFISAAALGLKGDILPKEWFIDQNNDHIYVGGQFYDSLAVAGNTTLQTENMQMFVLETSDAGRVFHTYKISRPFSTYFGKMAKRGDLYVSGLEDNVRGDSFNKIVGRYRQTEPRVTLDFGSPDVSPIYYESEIEIPVLMSTLEYISFTQFIVEYDENMLELQRVETGDNAGGFTLLTNENLPFTPNFQGLNANILLQLSGTGKLSGENIEVAKLIFKTKRIGGNTDLAFDTREGHFGFSIFSSSDVPYEDALLNPGSVYIFGYDGTFEIPDVQSAFTDTIDVPVTLSIAKHITDFQCMLEYDTTALSFYGAVAGADAQSWQVVGRQVHEGTPTIRSGQLLLKLSGNTPMQGRDLHIATIKLFPKKAPRTGSNVILNIIRFHDDSYFTTAAGDKIPVSELYCEEGLINFTGKSWNVKIDVRLGDKDVAIANSTISVTSPLGTEQLYSDENGTAEGTYLDAVLEVNYAKSGDQRTRSPVWMF